MTIDGVKNKLIPGALYLVATPIGNLADISQRAIDTLAGVDIILCEDTRKTGMLLKHLGLSKPLESYYIFNEAGKVEMILSKLLQGGTVALISSAGTPLICDPGQRLVKECISRDIQVISIPGASAVITALVVSGFCEEAFHFAGWLPRKGKERDDALRHLSVIIEPVVIYESPNRLEKTLRDIAALTPDREAAIARELTKIHEEVLRGTCASLAEVLEGKVLKGECVIVLGPVASQDTFDTEKNDMVYKYFSLLKQEGMSPGKAAKVAARLLGLPPNDVYRRFVTGPEVEE